MMMCRKMYAFLFLLAVLGCRQDLQTDSDTTEPTPKAFSIDANEAVFIVRIVAVTEAANGRLLSCTLHSMLEKGERLTSELEPGVNVFIKDESDLGSAARPSDLRQVQVELIDEKSPYTFRLSTFR